MVTRPPKSSRDSWMGLSLLIVTVLAYWPALSGGFVWDDDRHITATALRSWDGLRRIWFDVGATQQYYPLLHSAFWVEARLWGDEVIGYHLLNVLLHVIAACLVVEICKRLEIRGGWLAAFIFALHPVHVESVAWISEQKNTLSLVFYLLSAICYLRFDRGRATRDYALALALFILALLTKTVTATLPAALLVVFWWQRGRPQWKRDLLPLVPWFALAAVAGVFTAYVERRLIGAEGVEFSLGAPERLLLSARVVCFYIWKLVWPANLMFTYPHWTVNARDVAQYVFPVALVAAAFALWRLRTWNKGPVAGFVIFVGSLFPVLGFFNIYPFRYSFVANHFQYLASLGVIVPCAAGLTAFAGRARTLRGTLSPRAMPAAMTLATNVAMMVMLGGLGALTFVQSRWYRGAESLYTATIARNPDDWMAHNNLGRILSRIPARRAEEISHYEAVLRLKPDHARAHYSLGVALYLSDRGAEAVPHFESALGLEPGNPPLVALSHFFLGEIFLATPGRLPDALSHLAEEVRLRPDDPEGQNGLGEALWKSGRASEARTQFETALRLKPDYVAARENLVKLGVAKP